MSNEILFLLCFNPVFTIWQFSFIGNEASWSQVSKSNKNDLLNYMEENDFLSQNILVMDHQRFLSFISLVVSYLPGI